MTGNKGAFGDPRIAEMTGFYVNHYMAILGPFVSSVFFALMSNSAARSKRPASYIKCLDMSLAELANRAGISKRKGIDALKVLKSQGIIMQRGGRGRGNMNRYYFLPCATWFRPGTSLGGASPGQC